METRILTSWVVVRIKLNVKMPGTGPNSSRHSLELLDKYISEPGSRRGTLG